MPKLYQYKILKAFGHKNSINGEMTMVHIWAIYRNCVTSDMGCIRRKGVIDNVLFIFREF